MSVQDSSASVARAQEASADWLVVYRDMLAIRLFERQAEELYRKGLMPGLAHSYVGQEGVAVGVCHALRDEDYITSTHRGHGHCVAKGASLDRMFAELLGKAAGYCNGKGGTMHIADAARGNLGANAIVAGSVGIATGAAFSAVRQSSDRVAVCFFGDGALGQGILYEVMNMASLWHLPVVYVCEDNLYSEFTHRSETLAGDLLDRPRAFAIPAQEVDGQDVRAVYTAASAAVAAARAGDGPSFLMCHTYRQGGHHVGDIERTYRTRGEERAWAQDRDPIEKLAEWMLRSGNVRPEDLDRVREQLESQVVEAVQFALDSPFPEVSAVDEDVYREPR